MIDSETRRKKRAIFQIGAAIFVVEVIVAGAVGLRTKSAPSIMAWIVAMAGLDILVGVIAGALISIGESRSPR